MIEEIDGWYLRKKHNWETIDGRVKLSQYNTGQWRVECVHTNDVRCLVTAGLTQHAIYFRLDGSLKTVCQMLHEMIGCQRHIRVDVETSGYWIVGTESYQGLLAGLQIRPSQRGPSGKYRWALYADWNTYAPYQCAAASMEQSVFATRHELLTALREHVDPPLYSNHDREGIAV